MLVPRIAYLASGTAVTIFSLYLAMLSQKAVNYVIPGSSSTTYIGYIAHSSGIIILALLVSILGLTLVHQSGHTGQVRFNSGMILAILLISAAVYIEGYSGSLAGGYVTYLAYVIPDVVTGALVAFAALAVGYFSGTYHPVSGETSPVPLGP